MLRNASTRTIHSQIGQVSAGMKKYNPSWTLIQNDAHLLDRSCTKVSAVNELNADTDVSPHRSSRTFRKKTFTHQSKIQSVNPLQVFSSYEHRGV